MRKMFDPKTVALIGASESEGSVGRTIMENLLGSGGRAVFPINPKHPSILDVPTFRSVSEVPEKIDLAVVATPAATVPDVLKECADAGVSGAIVVSAGFGETGREGQALERKIKKILAESPMRVVGPNCLGIIRPTVGLNASFLKVSPEAGNIALISQSGALGTGMLDWAVSSQIGFSMFASVGAMVDVDFADLIDFLGEDPQTRSILIYMENVGNARRFMSAARSFARNKPIIVLKPGRYSESAAAALSHTGSMAGGDEIYEAAFRRAGVVRVHEVAELFHAAEVLESHRLPKGADVAIVTNAGGLGVMATDAVIGMGGRMAELSDKTMATLNEALPPYWSHSNPVDVLGDAGSDRFSAAVKACLADSSVNGVLLIYTPQGNSRPDAIAEEVSALVKKSPKPLVATLMGGKTVDAGREIFLANGVPCFETPEEAVRAYVDTYKYARNLELLYETPGELPIDVAPPGNNLRALLRRVAGSGRKVLTEEESKQFISTYGFPVVEQQIARTRDEALLAAQRLGYPVVLKIVSHDITHKSAVGGVEVGVCSAADLEKAYDSMLERVSKNAPDARIEGVSVQYMVRDVDFELIVGMKKDWQFGSVIVFGSGGVRAEGLKDFSVALPPLNQVLARRMMEETKVFQTMVDPHMGIVPPDIAELEELLTVMSNIVVDFPEIAEIDVNPVVISHGKPIAVDARIVIDEYVLKGKPRGPHMVVTPYPTRYTAPWRLTDGTEVLLRPIRPEDEPMIAELLATVSEKTLRMRFLGNVRHFDHDSLVRFVNIDYDREMAIVAEYTQGKKKRIIGVGRLIGDPDRGCGEFSALIHDDFQGRGLGFKLVDMIIGIAQDKGFEAIDGHISADNHPMLGVAQDLGFTLEGREDGVVTVKLALA